VGIGRGLDYLRVKHEANGAQFRNGTVLGELVVERVHLLDRLLRIRHQLQVLIAFLGELDVLSIDGLPQPGKHGASDPDGADEVADVAYHGLNSVAVGPITERDDLLTTLACGLMRHARVAVDRSGTGDVGAGQDGDALVVLTKVVVESACAFKVGVLKGRDGETESGGEGLPQLGDLVEEGVEREELGASDGTSDYLLDEGHLDGGEASIGEDLLNDVGSDNGVVVEEGGARGTRRNE